MDEHEQHDPLARPAGACVLCPPPKGQAWTRADDRYVTCSPCADRMRERIAEIAERYLRLDPRPGAQGFDGGRGSPGFVSRPPLSLHVVSLRDPRSSQDSKVWVGRDGRVHQEEVRPPLSVYGTLSTLSWAVAEHRDVAGPGDRDDEWVLLKFLDRNLDYVTRSRELAVEVDTALRDLVAALRPLTGDRRRRIGQCPMAVEVEGEDDPQRCGQMLYAPADDATVIRCAGCGHSWRMDEWLTLGDVLDPAEGDA